MKRTRILSILLSVCMILTCMAGMGVTASAVDLIEETLGTKLTDDDNNHTFEGTNFSVTAVKVFDEPYGIGLDANLDTATFTAKNGLVFDSVAFSDTWGNDPAPFISSTKGTVVQDNSNVNITNIGAAIFTIKASRGFFCFASVTAKLAEAGNDLVEPTHLEDLTESITATDDVTLINGLGPNQYVKFPGDDDYTTVGEMQTVVLPGGHKYKITKTQVEEAGDPIENSYRYVFEYDDNDEPIDDDSDDDDDDDDDDDEPRRPWAEKPTYVPSGTSGTKEPTDEDKPADEPKDDPQDDPQGEPQDDPQDEPQDRDNDKDNDDNDKDDVEIPNDRDTGNDGTSTVVDGSKDTNENPHTGAALGGLTVLTLAGAAMIVSKKRK